MCACDHIEHAANRLRMKRKKIVTNESIKKMFTNESIKKNVANESFFF